MKILRIRFKNINSFYGEHPPIDFTSSPLSDTGLFIISGPTGAGKSTLLDVISLALYNQVPRFDKSISSNEISSQGSVVNSKAAEEEKAEAYAEIEYEARGKQYRSRWSIAKNRNGKWKSYSMEIADLATGALLDVKGLSNFPKKNEELIGLSYEQFVKSIILAQGSFAEFLKANRNVRSQLLEDITMQHIYREIGKAAYDKEKAEADILRDKQSEMKGVQLLSEEAIAEITEKKKKVDLEKKLAEEQFAYWDAEYRLLVECTTLQTKLEEVKKQQTQLAREVTEFAPSAARLAQHESLSMFAGDLRELTNTGKATEELQKRITDLTRQKETLAQEHARLLEAGSALVGKSLTADTFSEAIDLFEKKVSEINEAIKTFRDKGSPIVDSIKQEVQNTSLDGLKQLSTKEIGTSLHTLRTAKQAQQVYLDYYPEDFDAEAKLTTLNSRIESLITLSEATRSLSQLTVQGNLKKEAKKEAEQEVETNKPLLLTIREEIKNLTTEINRLREERDKELTRSKFEDQRKQLKEGEECPLCGSVHHPFVHEYVNNLLDLQEKIKAQELRQQTLQKKEQGLDTTNKAAEKQIQQLDTELASMRIDYAATKGKIQTLLNDLHLPKEQNEETIEAEKNLIDAERKRVREWGTAKEASRVIQRMEASFLKLKDLTDQAKVQHDALKELYSGTNVKEDVKTLTQKWQNCTSAANNNHLAITDHQKQYEEATAKHKSLSTQLLQSLGQVGINSIDEANSRLLGPQEVSTLKDRREALEKNKTTLTTREKTLAEELVQKNASRKELELNEDELKSNSSKYQRLRDTYLRESSGYEQQLKSDAEARDRNASLQREIEQLQKEHRKWQLLKNYIGDATGNAFSNFAQSLTLNNLIGLANTRLRVLSDRYVLEKPKSDADGLFVLDTYQGNSPRAVSTLSGGETFTLSLALALALSDLASRTIKIESLFIDEGFGTLDSDTLETALATLEKLQTDSQKTVGVISHRHEMKDRIPVQIQVEKAMDGTSKVKIVGG